MRRSIPSECCHCCCCCVETGSVLLFRETRTRVLMNLHLFFVTQLPMSFFNRHYYIATSAKANGTLHFAAGEMGASESKRKPLSMPYIHPRTTSSNAHLFPDPCTRGQCRHKKDGPAFIEGRIRHGDSCNGSTPAWQGHLVVELLTPAPMLQPLLHQCHSVVLASGSLAPLLPLCAECGLTAETTATTQKPTMASPATTPSWSRPSTQEFSPSMVPPYTQSQTQSQSQPSLSQASGSQTTDPRETAANESHQPDSPPTICNRLQMKPKPLEANHVVNLQKQLMAVSIGSFADGSPLTVTYSNWNNPSFIPKLGVAIASVVESIPTGGVLIFLPSYSFLKKCVECWNPDHYQSQRQFINPFWNSSGAKRGWGNRNRGRRRYGANGFGDDEDDNNTTNSSEVWDRLVRSKGHVVVESTGSQAKFEETKNEYSHWIQTHGSCILLAVFRGKMSEGISFNDENARGVICVGIPLPNAFDRSVLMKKKYNDEQRRVNGRTDLLPGGEWYSQQAFRAISQALGRCIRHAGDYGTVVLMDSRHCNGTNRHNLPKWMRHHLRTLSMRQHDMGMDMSMGMDGDSVGSNGVILGGWTGLRSEMSRFFREASPYGAGVLQKQKEQMEARCRRKSESESGVGGVAVAVGVGEVKDGPIKIDPPAPPAVVPEACVSSSTTASLFPPAAATRTTPSLSPPTSADLPLPEVSSPSSASEQTTTSLVRSNPYVKPR